MNSSKPTSSQPYQLHGGPSTEDGLEPSQSNRKDSSSSSATFDGESEPDSEATSPRCNTSEARPKKAQWAPIVTVTLMLIVDGLGFSTAGAPQMRMYEDIVCRRYFAAQSGPGLSIQQAGNPPSITEEMCKTPAVQEAVARLFGWQGFFDGIPGLLLAMYYGALADRKGRRGVLVLSMIGQVLGLAWVLFVCWTGLPLEFAWMSSIFLIIGGGSTVTGAIATMILADSSPDHLRSRVFFYSSAGLIASTVAGSALGSFLMERTSLWTPLLLGLGCTAATACLAALMPESLRSVRRGATGSREKRPGRMAFLTDALCQTRVALGFILANRVVFTLIAASLVVDFARHSMSILLQYLSTQYNMSIAEANYLLSFRSAAQLLAFTVIFPALDTYMTRRLRGQAKRKDLRLIKLSVVLMAAGFAILALAPNIPTVIGALVVYILGSGYGSFARSLMSSLTQPTMLGTLFTTLSVMESIGTLLTSPAIAAVFGWTMKMGGMWPGLLFLIACILCFGVFVVLAVRASVVDEEEKEVPVDEEQVAFLDGEGDRADRV